MAITHRRLGKHGALVSNICLGTMNFGWHTSEKDSFAIMDKALELGINFFDTADVYGWTVRRGHTEEIIGRWLAQGGARRESIVLATKVYNPVDNPGAPPEPNRDGRNLSAVKIRRHCEGSLKRLQTDCLDLYQMHHVDRDCPWDEVWSAFDALVKQGKIVYVGSSNFPGWDIATACQEAARRNMQGLASEQSIYNLSNGCWSWKSSPRAGTMVVASSHGVLSRAASSGEPLKKPSQVEGRMRTWQSRWKSIERRSRHMKSSAVTWARRRQRWVLHGSLPIPRSRRPS